MASTYKLIKGETLASSAASYTFSAIPSTWTDLVVRASARSDYAQAYDDIKITVNGATTNFSWTSLTGNGASASSGQGSSADGIQRNWMNGDGSTSNSFGSTEFYISSYAGSANKVISGFSVEETNSTTPVYMGAVAGLWSDTSAITSVTLKLRLGSNFLSGSSFYLYGIKNS